MSYVNEVMTLYDGLMFSGAQTVEKHLRWIAESLVKEFEGGFKVVDPQDRRRNIPFRVEGANQSLQILIPAGCHGFALQMAIETQIRRQLNCDPEQRRTYGSIG